MTERIFCHFGQFLAHLPPKNLENQNFEKLKKIPGDIIMLNRCTKNHDHMLYCSRDMAHDRCNSYFSFWAIFYPFTPLTARKMKISKKWKKVLGDVIILHKCTKNYDNMVYCSWDMARDGYNCYFSFWTTFALLPSPLTAQKIKISKKEKKMLEDIIILHICTKNYD